MTKKNTQNLIKGSRIGKLPIAYPKTVKVTVQDNHVLVEGPKGKLAKNFDKAVRIEQSEGSLSFFPVDSTRFSKSMHGTARAIVQNMIHGVQEYFVKNLEISGTGYKAIVKGKNLELTLGKSHLDIYSIPEGIIVTVTDNTKIKVEGIDCHLVGQVAAHIYHFKKVEPYKAKGVVIVGQFIRRKEGKKTA